MTAFLYLASLILGLGAICLMVLGLDKDSKLSRTSWLTYFGHMCLVVALFCSPNNYISPFFFVALVGMVFVSLPKTDIHGWLQIISFVLLVCAIAIYGFRLTDGEIQSPHVNTGLFLLGAGLGLLSAGNFQKNYFESLVGAVLSFLASIAVLTGTREPSSAIISLYCFVHLVLFFDEKGAKTAEV